MGWVSIGSERDANDIILSLEIKIGDINVCNLIIIYGLIIKQRWKKNNYF